MLINGIQTIASAIGAGGLFDFNATLPFLAIQFLILTFILNTILYNPLLTVINERNEYIVSNLTQSAKLIAETNEIKQTYEKEILEARKTAQLEIAQCQKVYKEIFDLELVSVQQEFDKVLEKLVYRLEQERNTALIALEAEIESISEQILEKIFV